MSARLAVVCAAAVVALAGGVDAATAGAVPDKPRRGCDTPWCEKVRTTRAIALRLDRVFRRYGSPLAGYGVEHARAGRRWNVSPFFMAIASAIESTFGTAACGYNAWGWGACSFGFASWEAGILYTARRMRELMDTGLRDLYSFGSTYCPPCASGWGSRQAAWQRSIFHVAPSMTYQQAARAIRA